MFKIIPWSAELDLSNFYKEADQRGFKNNASQQALVECFNNETEKQVWILYFKDQAVGSVAAHSFDDVMGPNSYRIAARTCAFTDLLPIHHLRTRTGITTHQNITAQFLIPVCIEWAPKGSRLFITSNESSVGTQRKVHSIFCPTLEKQGTMQRIKEVMYRSTLQTVWEFFPNKFYEELDKNPRWI